MSYTSIHNHTHYSNLRLIDAINTEETLIDRAFELGLKGVAITDHETVSGHVKALNYFNKKYADQKDFKLILGNEIYLARSDLTSETHEKAEKFHHLVLLAKDKVGHRQLRQLSSRAWSRGYFKNMMRVPTFWEDMEEIIGADPGHIMATTACLGGVPASMFLDNRLDDIEPFLKKMSNLLGHDKFFIELQPSFQQDQIEFNKHMIINFWDKYNFVFTTDSHYLKKEDQEIHRWFLQSKSGDREIDQFYSSAYVMDYEEVLSYFSGYISMPKIEAMKENTNLIHAMVESYSLDHGQIVPKIEYELDRFDKEKTETVRELFAAQDLNKYKYLKYFLETDNITDSYLINLILEGYYDKILILENQRTKQITNLERIERLDYELEQIHETSIQINQSLSDYFITMAKMIEIIWNEGDSMVGPGRGSAAGFLTNYLIGITQIDPQNQDLYLPPWRFIHKDRPGLPDIDIDTESNKRTKIFNKIREYFNNIGSDVVNVCTFGTEGSKSAIRTAGRSLDIDDSVVSYLTSMVPNERGFDLSLSQCYNGDDEHNPIKEFVVEMDNNPNLKKLAFAIEGLITRLGVHAAGVLILDGDPSEYNSIMKTSKGVFVSGYNLEDSEQMGGLKYDMLTVAALDKIHTTINYLLEDRVIDWQGNLRDTYNKYLLPAILEYKDKSMWRKLWEGEVVDAFQFDTMVGSQAIRLIHPETLAELAIANSIMRLMAQQGMELPLDTFVKYKKNIEEWYHELELYGLAPEHIEVLEKHLKPLYGVADSQESVMMLTMDSKIANFSLNDANYLRKAIGKKDFETLQKTKQMFYEKGDEIGTSRYLLDYVWNVQIGRQIGYAFSILHTMAYSTITLQQMNLVHKFPSIYWKTACLSVNAGAINEEDFYNLVEEGVIELSDEDDVRSSKKIQYGKVASAIGDMRGTIEILQPDINLSRMGFTPDASNNAILYGLKGITRVGDNIIQEIILNRPYTSLRDFVEKMTTSDDKKLISKDKIVNLIKAGAFDRLENKPREQILREFINGVAETKNRLNLQNFMMLMRKNLVPENLEEEKKCYNFTKYIRKNRYNNHYIIDEVAIEYLLERFPPERIVKILKDREQVDAISETWWDAIYNQLMNNIRTWINTNHDYLISELNDTIFSEEYEKYARGNILDWELQSLNFFYSGHPLDGIEFPIEVQNYNKIREGEIVGHFLIKGKSIPKMKLSTISGTVIDKDKTKSIVTLATKESVVDVKFYKQQFAKFAHESNLDEDDENYKPNEENFLEKGTHLVITGIKRGDMFIPKVYKNTGIQSILKAIVKDGQFVEFKAKADS